LSEPSDFVAKIEAPFAWAGHRADRRALCTGPQCDRSGDLPDQISRRDGPL